MNVNIQPEARESPSSEEFTGHVDILSNRHVVGWVWNQGVPLARIPVGVRLSGETIGEQIADNWREDLLHAGIGDGHHGFDISFQRVLSQEDLALVTIEVRGSRYVIPNTAQTIRPWPWLKGIKIFQIGFNKCGTTTIHNYLTAHGVRSVHWDDGRLAKRMFRNLTEGENLLAGYEEWDAFTDMEYLDRNGAFFLEAYKLFPYLAAQYPEAVFILNTRDREAWIRSRFLHLGNWYAGASKSFYGVSSDAALADLWRADWERHHMRVIEFFAATPHRFFLCNIETNFPHLLKEKLFALALNHSRTQGPSETEAQFS